jgi:hypothetical protein
MDSSKLGAIFVYFSFEIVMRAHIFGMMVFYQSGFYYEDGENHKFEPPYGLDPVQ